MTGQQQPDNWIVERKAGEVLYQAGDAATCCFVVAAGELELTREGAAVARLGPGDVCGLLGLSQGTPQALGARVAKDARLLRLEAADLGARRPTPSSGRCCCGRSLASSRPPWPRPAARRPRLVADDGHEFVLPAEGSALVGRGDAASGHKPDLDLSALDAKRSLSRRHARLRREGPGLAGRRRAPCGQRHLRQRRAPGGRPGAAPARGRRAPLRQRARDLPRGLR